MKVFNEEVNCCQDCPFLDHTGMDGEDSYCNKLHKYVTERSIDKDCPFNKPVTKEVIEGFGFVQNHANNAKMYSIFKDTYSVFLYRDGENYFEVSNCHDTINIHGSAVEWLFRGTINNPIELEFILRSIGVI